MEKHWLRTNEIRFVLRPEFVDAFYSEEERTMYKKVEPKKVLQQKYELRDIGDNFGIGEPHEIEWRDVLTFSE